MQRHKILLIIPTLQIGGSEKQVFYLARGLSYLDQDVTVATFYPGGLFWDKLSQENLKVFSFNRKGRLDFLSFSKNIAHFIKENNFDIVQTFLPVANFFGIRAAYEVGMRKIFAGIRSSYIDLSKYSIGNKIYFNLSKEIINKYATGIIYNSYAGEKYHQALGFKSKSSVIWNAIDFQEIESANINKSIEIEKLGLPLDSLVISTVARFDPMKDFDTLIKAFSIISKERKNIYLLILGDGNLNIKGRIITQIKALGIEDKVKLLGFKKDVYGVVGSSDLFICSSRGEGLSNSLIEAMSLGVAAISTDVGDHSFLLAEKRGLIVKSGDPQALAKEISEVLLKGDLRSSLFKNAYKFARDNFSLERMVKSYLESWDIN